MYAVKGFAAIENLMMSPRRFSTRKAAPVPLSDRTKSNYGVRVRSFGKWLVKVGRTQHNRLAGVDTVGGSAIEPRHTRRALAVSDVTKLLDAAERRPVAEMLTIRRGKRAGQQGAKVSAENLARAQHSGLERKTIYMLAVWTGLRRSEIKSLQWGDCHCGVQKPFIQLRAVATKNRKADRVPLHSEITQQLTEWRQRCTQLRADAGPQQHELVFEHLPSMVTYKSDLKFAGVAYKVEGKGVVDFHSLRKTCSTRMAAADLPARIRQSAMRHSTPGLTETTYMDEDHLPVYEHVAGMERLGA